MTKLQQAFAVLILVVGYGVVGRLDYDDELRLADKPPALRLLCRDADAPAADERALDRPKAVMVVARPSPTRLTCVVTR